MPLEFAGATDVGRKRDHNEDALMLLPENGVAVVCDGMGGHEAGEVASGIGVETVKRFFDITKDPDATWPFRYDKTLDEASNLITVAAEWANQRIREAAAEENGRRRGMGTTYVAMLLQPPGAWFGWVGDSRGYHFRKGALTPTTSDHSLLNELIKTGRMTEQDIANFQHKNIITRALGMGDETQVDITRVDLEPGDVCLICCDGLTGMISEQDMANILTQEPDLTAACNKLINAANAAGGLDNVTVALARWTP
jgi:protein phosphatase